MVEAVAREVLEETGLQVRVGAELGRVEIPFAEGAVYDVTDFSATPVEPSPPHPVAGDDASAVAWVSREELAALDCSPGLAQTLEQWSIWSTVS